MMFNTTNCFGPWRAGAIVALYPEGVWYGGVAAAEDPEFVESHTRSGKPVERLLRTELTDRKEFET